MTQTGLVVASHGRHCMVESMDGERRICHPRGKKSQVVVGDQVEWLPSTDEGTIEKILPRRNLFYRQDEIRTKSFAANLDQVVILLAAEPEFSQMQLTRALIPAEAEHITPIIAFNSSDLTALFAGELDRLSPYTRMGSTGESEKRRVGKGGRLRGCPSLCKALNDPVHVQINRLSRSY